MQVNPEDGPPEIYVTWSDPRMTDFENSGALTWKREIAGQRTSESGMEVLIHRVLKD